jgi:hypothetical protein
MLFYSYNNSRQVNFTIIALCYPTVSVVYSQGIRLVYNHDHAYIDISVNTYICKQSPDKALGRSTIIALRQATVKELDL